MTDTNMYEYPPITLVVDNNIDLSCDKISLNLYDNSLTIIFNYDNLVDYKFFNNVTFEFYYTMNKSYICKITDVYFINKELIKKYYTPPYFYRLSTIEVTSYFRFTGSLTIKEK